MCFPVGRPGISAVVTSLWLSDRVQQPWAASRLEEGPRSADVIVVGAGITGLMTAVLLARAGKDVLVVEARTVGACATGNTTAKISLLQGTHLSKIVAKHGKDLARAYVDGNREGQDWVLQHCQAHGVDVQREDAYTYAQSAEGVPSAKAELKACQAVGLPAFWDDDASVPFPYHGGVCLPHQAQFDPMLFLDSLAVELLNRGGRLVEYTRVRRVSWRGKKLRVYVNDAAQQDVQLEAGRLVLATGMPILDRGGFFARLKPSRSYCLAYKVPGDIIRPMMISTDSPTRSVRYAPVADGERLIVGGAGHTVGRERSPSKALDELSSWARLHYPGAVQTHFWSGARPHAHRRSAVRRPDPAEQRKHLCRNGFQQVGDDERARGGVGARQPHPGWPDGLVARVRKLEPARTVRAADRDAVQRRGRLRLAKGWITPATRTGHRDPGEDEGGVVSGPPWHLGGQMPRRRRRAPGVAGVHPPGRDRELERRRQGLGMPAAWVALRAGRHGARKGRPPAT